MGSRLRRAMTPLPVMMPTSPVRSSVVMSWEPRAVVQSGRAQVAPPAAVWNSANLRAGSRARLRGTGTSRS
jgi:hypothetical protein